MKKAAVDRQSFNSDPRIKSAMQTVLNVYEKFWDNADLYEYYSREDSNK